MDTLTDLHISIAVLKNELKHARKEKDDVVVAMRLLVGSLVRGSGVGGGSASRGSVLGAQEEEEEKGKRDVKDLENEIERLRRENRGLRRQVKGVETVALRHPVDDVDPVSKADSETSFNGNEIDESIRQDGGEGERFESQEESLLRGHVGGMKEKECLINVDEGGDEDLGINGHDADFQFKGQQDTVIARAENFEHENGTAGAFATMSFGSQWGENFTRDTSSVFSSSQACHQAQAGPSPSESFQSSDEPPESVTTTPLLSPAAPGAADVGLHSLEDFLNETPACPLAQSFSSSLKKQRNDDTGVKEIEFRSREAEAKDDGVPIGGQHIIMPRSNNLPPPTVLKTGFELKGSFRGEVYDFSNPSPSVAPTYSRHGNMSTYDRFNTANQASSSRPRSESRCDSDIDLWKSREEMSGAIEIHKRSCGPKDVSRFPGLFRHGILFSPSETDSNYMRTVQISGLPRGIKLRDVVSRVRGGEIVSAVLLDTMSLTGTMSARVVFLHEAIAEEYVTYTSTHALTFDEDDVQTEVRVTLVPTPTYPLPSRTLHKVLPPLSQTRCLRILSVPQSFSLSALEHKLARGNRYNAESLIEMWVDRLRTLHLEFASLEIAGIAYAILTRCDIYRALEVEFERDPCAGPLEELALPIPPKSPMFASRFRTEVEVGAETKRRNGEDEVIASVEAVGKPVLALDDQSIVIPSLGGLAIEGSSWADEVNEVESGNSSAAAFSSLTPPSRPNSPIGPLPSAFHVPPNSPQLPCEHISADREGGRPLQKGIEAVMVENVNEMMLRGSDNFWNGKLDRPTGLAGSKYANIVPDFVDKTPAPRLLSLHAPNPNISQAGQDVMRNYAVTGPVHTSPISSSLGAEDGCGLKEILPLVSAGSSIISLQSAAASAIDTPSTPSLATSLTNGAFGKEINGKSALETDELRNPDEIELESDDSDDDEVLENVVEVIKGAEGWLREVVTGEINKHQLVEEECLRDEGSKGTYGTISEREANMEVC